MKNFYEWINDENFNNWLLSERHSKKEALDLYKMLEDAGFTHTGGTKENKWTKDGIPVTVSRASNLPARQIFNSVMRDWQRSKERIESFKNRRAV